MSSPAFPVSPQPDPGRLRTPVSDLQQSNGLPEAGPEEAKGELGRAPAPEPVRFGWVKGVMVSATLPTGSSLLPSPPQAAAGCICSSPSGFSQCVYFSRALNNSLPSSAGWVLFGGAGEPTQPWLPPGACTLRAGPPLSPPRFAAC